MTGQTDAWDFFRRQMPVTKKWAYFDHAGVSPLPATVRKVYGEWLDHTAANGAVDWTVWRNRVEVARERAARLVECRLEEIALVHNTTEGIGLIAEGFPWKAGDNIVAPASEFPSNLYPWKNLESRGVELRLVATDNERLDLDRLADACDHRTRIVSVSWVGYITGWRNDLAAVADMAHRRGAVLFVDAIQGLGVLPLDLSQTPIDFLAADGHKWMLGPEGAGLLFIREEHLAELRPLGVGWNSVRHAGEFTNPAYDLKPNAGRYEGGSYNLGGIAALAESLRLLLEPGANAVMRRIEAVTARLCDRLRDEGAEVVSDRSPQHWSGIVSFDVPGKSPLALKQQSRDRGVVLNARGGHVRASPHLYTNDDDIERLVAAVCR